MSKQIATQATAFGLAAMVTLVSLGSLGALADTSVAGHELARGDGAPVQQVVIVGQKSPMQQVVIVGQKATRG